MGRLLSRPFFLCRTEIRSNRSFQSRLSLRTVSAAASLEPRAWKADKRSLYSWFIRLHLPTFERVSGLELDSCSIPSQPVTAPCAAEPTSLTYLANTPVAYFGAGAFHFDKRSFNSESATFSLIA